MIDRFIPLIFVYLRNGRGKQFAEHLIALGGEGVECLLVEGDGSPYRLGGGRRREAQHRHRSADVHRAGVDRWVAVEGFVRRLTVA